MPTFLLKRQVLVNLPTDNLEPQVATSIDFMVDKVSIHYMIIELKFLFSRWILSLGDNWLPG